MPERPSALLLKAHNAFYCQLVDAGVGAERAQAEADKRFPAAAELRADVLEKDEQKAVTKLFIERGFRVRSTSQARRSKVALGLPDLIVHHKTKPVAFWWETKRQVGGHVSEAQQTFGDDCLRCGWKWAAGDRHAARRFLEGLGLTAPP